VSDLPETPDDATGSGTRGPYGPDDVIRTGKSGPAGRGKPGPTKRGTNGPGFSGGTTAGPAAAERGTSAPDTPETDAERRRRRALFLRELAEARALRARVQPRRAKAARLRHALRMRTFRW